MSLHEYGTEHLLTILQAYDRLDYERMTEPQAAAVLQRIEQIQIVLHHRTFNLPASESILAVDVNDDVDWGWGKNG